MTAVDLFLDLPAIDRKTLAADALTPESESKGAGVNIDDILEVTRADVDDADKGDVRVLTVHGSVYFFTVDPAAFDDDTPESFTDVGADDLDKLTFKELKAVCDDLGLKKGGSTAALIDRIAQHLATTTTVPSGEQDSTGGTDGTPD